MIRDPAERLFIFAGGGTGGHIFPALAIAEQLRDSLEHRARFRFICSTRAIDASILSAEHVDFSPAPAQPFSLRPLGMLRFLRNWAPSVRLGRDLIRNARAELGRDAVRVVALGGFVAAPIVGAARAERCPVVLVNLDAVPGKANRWIAARAHAAFSTVSVEAPYARAWTTVGPIVRRSAIASCSPADARRQLGLDPDRPVLMITGGSQGAGSINTFIAALLHAHPAAFAGWQVLHQSGADAPTDLPAAYSAASIRAVVVPFVSTIGLWWRAADLAVSRAGAGSVAEAWASAVPTLFLPYPFHRDNHQRRNADVLLRAGTAIIHTDHIRPDANLADAGGALLALLADAHRRAAMRSAFHLLGPAHGAQAVAQFLTSF